MSVPPSATEILESLSRGTATPVPTRVPSPTRTPVPLGTPSRVPSVSRSSNIPSAMTPVRPVVSVPMSPRAVESPRAKAAVALEEMKEEALSHGDLISKGSVDAILLERGYLPLNKVFSEEGGSPQAIFVKAVNVYGFHIYVIPDVKGFLNIDENDLSVVKCLRGEMINTSVKLGAKHCAGTDACGVVIECGGGGICSLIREGTSTEMREQMFLYREGQAERTLMEADKMVPFPVFRLSEIMANDDLVLRNTTIVMKRLRHKAAKMCTEKLECFADALATTSHKLKEFIALKEKVHCDIERTVDLLRLSIDKCGCPKTLKEKEHRCKLLHNIVVREEFMIAELEACKRISLMSEAIHNVKETICSSIDLLQQIMLKQGKVFEVDRERYKSALSY